MPSLSVLVVPWIFACFILVSLVLYLLIMYASLIDTLDSLTD